MSTMQVIPTRSGFRLSALLPARRPSRRAAAPARAAGATVHRLGGGPAWASALTGAAVASVAMAALGLVARIGR